MVNEVLGVPKLQSIYELLSHVIDGKADLAIKSFHALNRNGSSVSLILEELLQLCNKVSKSIVIEKFIEDSTLFDHEKPVLRGLKETTDITSITNIWKLLLNGLTELKSSNHHLYVFEMILIRVCHLSNIPKLSEVIKSTSYKQAAPSQIPTNQVAKKLKTFKEVVDLFYKNKELILYKYLSDSIAIIEYRHGTIKASTNTKLPGDFTQQILALLNKWTNEKWVFELSSKIDTEIKTLKDQELDKIKDNDIVKAINSSFPGAEIKSISKIKN